MIKVYGNPLSTCTRKVLATLAEKGEKFDFVVLDFTKGEHKQPAHLARQPFGVVPVLEHDGRMLYESRAIIRYLDQVFPKPALTPPEPFERALMEQWISVEMSNFTPTAMKIVYQAMFNPMMYGKPTDQKVVDEARVALARTIDVMEAQLSKTQHIANDQFTLADICFMPYIEYLVACGNGDLITKREKAGAWWAKISERPSWKAATGK